MFWLLFGQFFKFACGYKRGSQTAKRVNGKTHNHNLGWAIYIVASSFNKQEKAISVEASWTVPQMKKAAGNGYSSAWVIIGEQTDKTLIQVGTEHNLLNSQERYHVWYEMLLTI